ncbi:MAG: hypothetical protein WD066_06180 [Planctomycetaceae bacterium]
MATAEEHENQAAHNHRFLGSIDRDEYPDWAATAIFYTAVHLVQMLFVKKGGAGGSHIKRNKTLRTDCREVWKSYQPFYAFSRLSRYWCLRVSASDIPYLERRLERVRRTIQELTAS